MNTRLAAELLMRLNSLVEAPDDDDDVLWVDDETFRQRARAGAYTCYDCLLLPPCEYFSYAVGLIVGH
jgi:hypothetical protein